MPLLLKKKEEKRHEQEYKTLKMLRDVAIADQQKKKKRNKVWMIAQNTPPCISLIHHITFLNVFYSCVYK